MEVAGVEPSEQKTEDVASQNDKESVETGYTQIPPQDIVSSCPELAVVIRNWGYLPEEVRDAMLANTKLANTKEHRRFSCCNTSNRTLPFRNGLLVNIMLGRAPARKLNERGSIIRAWNQYAAAGNLHCGARYWIRA